MLRAFVGGVTLLLVATSASATPFLVLEGGVTDAQSAQTPNPPPMAPVFASHPTSFVPTPPRMGPQWALDGGGNLPGALGGFDAPVVVGPLSGPATAAVPEPATL